jgi:hypothetical protein
MRYQLSSGAIFLALGLGLLSVSNRFEGPVLLHISRGHGVSLSDVIALLPLAVGAALIFAVFWRQRAVLSKQLKAMLAGGGAEIFCVGLGVGLVIAKGLAALEWKWLLTWAAVASPLLIALIIALRHD